MMVKKELQESVATVERQIMRADDGRCRMIAEQVYKKGKEMQRSTIPYDDDKLAQNVLHLVQGKIINDTRPHTLVSL